MKSVAGSSDYAALFLLGMLEQNVLHTLAAPLFYSCLSFFLVAAFKGLRGSLQGEMPNEKPWTCILFPFSKILFVSRYRMQNQKI